MIDVVNHLAGGDDPGGVGVALEWARPIVLVELGLGRIQPSVGILERSLGNANGTFRARQTFATGTGVSSLALFDSNGDGVRDIVTADTSDNKLSVLLGNGTTTTTTTTKLTGLQPITGVSLATQQDALLAQGQIDGYLDTVHKVSGTIGTALSRFQIAAHVASSVADVSQAAEARITDVDVATDVATLVRKQIIQQAATAMLAQANPQPALVLNLLQG